jgi:hypothetical protein
MSTNAPIISIAELARQCSEEASRFYRHLGDTLDRRMGAALGVEPDQDASRWFWQRQLSSRVGDGGISLPPAKPLGNRPANHKRHATAFKTLPKSCAPDQLTLGWPSQGLV